MRCGPADDAPNSLESRPIFDMMHASGSQPPVTIAIFGMSPSERFFGRRSWPSITGVSTHFATYGIVVCRRHLPVVTTIGTSVPGGTFSRTNLPSASVFACDHAPPGSDVVHCEQLTPSVNGPGGFCGT